MSTVLVARHTACGESNISSNDVIDANAAIQGWELQPDGSYEPEYTGHTEVEWNSQRPADPEKLYFCHECGEPIAASDLEFDVETAP